MDTRTEPKTDWMALFQDAANRTTLRREERARELEAALEEKGLKWQIVPGVTFLIKPEATCPVCRQGMVINLIYVLDLGHERVLRCWGLDGKPWPISDCHPHVDFSGYICMGNSHSPIQALTMGINVSGAYSGIMENWLSEATSHLECADSLMDGDWDDHDGEAMCVVCDEWYSEDDMWMSPSDDRWYCDDHFHDMHTRCVICQDYHLSETTSFYEFHRNEEICEHCLHDSDYQICGECNVVWRAEEMTQDRAGDWFCEDHAQEEPLDEEDEELEDDPGETLDASQPVTTDGASALETEETL